MVKNKDAETRDSSELMRVLRVVSNQGPLDLQSNALPTELFRLLQTNNEKNRVGLKGSTRE